MKAFDYTAQDELGLHARPAGQLVKKAGTYRSEIKITKNGVTASAKRLFAVMGLSVKKGDTISVTVDGEDEEQASAELAEFCRQSF